MSEDIVCLLAGQKRLKDKYKDQDMLPKVNKAVMAGTLEAIEDYLRSCHDVVRAPLAYIIRKTITVQTCDNYPKYVTNDEEMITRMLHPPPEKNKLHREMLSQSTSIWQSTR